MIADPTLEAQTEALPTGPYDYTRQDLTDIVEQRLVGLAKSLGNGMTADVLRQRLLEGKEGIVRDLIREFNLEKNGAAIKALGIEGVAAEKMAAVLQGTLENLRMLLVVEGEKIHKNTFMDTWTGKVLGKTGQVLSSLATPLKYALHNPVKTTLAVALAYAGWNWLSNYLNLSALKQGHLVAAGAGFLNEARDVETTVASLASEMTNTPVIARVVPAGTEALKTETGGYVGQLLQGYKPGDAVGPE